MGDWSFIGFEMTARAEVASLVVTIALFLLLGAASKKSWGGGIAIVLGTAFLMIFILNEGAFKSVSDQLYAIFTMN